MYITTFDIENISDAVSLTSYFKDLGFSVNRNNNEVFVSNYREENTQKVLSQGNDFLNQREAVFDSWSYKQEDEYDSRIINPYAEYGISEKEFY